MLTLGPSHSKSLNQLNRPISPEETEAPRPVSKLPQDPEATGGQATSRKSQVNQVSKSMPWCATSPGGSNHQVHDSLPPPGLRLQASRQICLQPQHPSHPLQPWASTPSSHIPGGTPRIWALEKGKGGPLQNGKGLPKLHTVHTHPQSSLAGSE